MAYNQEKIKLFSIEIDPKITQLLNLENKDFKADVINMFKDLKKSGDIMSNGWKTSSEK